MQKKAQTLAQIANHYGVAPATLRRWLKSVDIPTHRRLYTPNEIQQITDIFG